MITRFLNWWWGSIESLAILAGRRKPAQRSTRNLYILYVDTPVKFEGKLQEMLERYRKEYGIDFIVMEPGFRLQRFDDV